MSRYRDGSKDLSLYLVGDMTKNARRGGEESLDKFCISWHQNAFGEIARWFFCL